MERSSLDSGIKWEEWEATVLGAEKCGQVPRGERVAVPNCRPLWRGCGGSTAAHGGGGDVVIVSGIPNPGLPGKAPPELKQCLSGWVLDAAALATEIKPGTRGFLQDLTRGAGGVSVLVLRPALQTLVSLQRASWLLSSQLV